MDDGIEASPFPAASRAPSPLTRRLLEGPILSTLLTLAAPTIAVMVIQVFVSTAEAYFVSRLGPDAFAGIALSFPLIMLMNGMAGAAMGGAIASAISRALGAGRRDDAEKLVVHALALAVALGLLFTVGMLLGGPAIYRAMGASGASLEAALVYSDLIFMGAVPFWVFNALASVFRGTGNTATPATISAGGALLAVALSPPLIFGFGPLPGLGLTGAGVAVLVFYVVGLVVSGWYLLTRRAGLLPSSLRGFRFEGRLFADLLRVGAPSSLNTAQASLTGIVLTGLVGPFGRDAVAGFGAGVRVEFLLVPVVFGLGSALVPLVGANVGAGNVRRARRATWTAVGLAAAFCCLVGVGVALVPSAWLGLFSDDANILAAGSAYLRAVGPAYAFFGIGLVLYFASQGAGSAVAPLAAGLVRLGVAVAGGLLVTRGLGLGLGALFGVMALAVTGFGTTMAAVVLAGPLHREPRPPRPSLPRIGEVNDFGPVPFRKAPHGPAAGHPS